MRTTTVMLNTRSKYNIIRHSSLSLGWRRHVCPDYKILLVEHASRNLLQIFSAVILWIWFESAVYRTNLLAADYFSMEIPIGTQFMHRHVSSMREMDRQMKFINSKALLLGGAPNKPTVRGSESMEDDCCEPPTDKRNKKMDFYPVIMRHKVAFCKHVTLHFCTQVRIKEVTNISSLVHTDPKSFLWIGRRVCPADRIYETAMNKLYEI